MGLCRFSWIAFLSLRNARLLKRCVLFLVSFLVIADFAPKGWAQKPVEQASTMKMGQYLSLGPVRDSAHPELAFPIFDLFSPSGQLLYHAGSVDEVMLLIKDGLPSNLQPLMGLNFPSDTLNDIAIRYPDLSLQTDRLLGRYTLLYISAPGCSACELQEKPLLQADPLEKGINLVTLTLTL
jgi:hypothetical protein